MMAAKVISTSANPAIAAVRVWRSFVSGLPPSSATNNINPPAEILHLELSQRRSLVVRYINDRREAGNFENLGDHII